jgi:hypothetical protein
VEKRSVIARFFTTEIDDRTKKTHVCKKREDGHRAAHGRRDSSGSSMVDGIRYELRGISFENFVLFLFEREVSVESEEDAEHWYYTAEIAFEPREVAAHYIRLFKQPEFLLSQFSRRQLEEGFWAIRGPNLECGVYTLMWIEELPFSIRADCIRAMFHLFERLFAQEPLETSAQMWWDSLCYDWHCGNRSRDKGGEDQLMQDVLFETLSRILDLDSVICQGAALHGLGHLHHPSTEQLVDGYLERRPGIDPKLKEYALAAARFRVL